MRKSNIYFTKALRGLGKCVFFAVTSNKGALPIKGR